MLTRVAVLSALLVSLFSTSLVGQNTPNVSYTSPSSGPVGTSVTIVGQYFGAAQGSSTVSFNRTQATPTSWSDTQIVAPVPSGAATGMVSVTVNGVVSNGGYGPTFTVGTPPNVSYTNPASGPIGTAVTITGQYFGATQGTSTVSFNGTQATPSSWSDTQIVAPVPAGATTGKVSVTVNGVVSNGGYGPTFTVGTPPNVSYTNPASGPVGTVVTITGQYFGATQGTSTVSFNGTQAMPTSWSDTQIVAPVPSGATTGKVSVTVNGVVSNGGYGPTFTVGTPPNVSYTSPPSGPPGTSVTIVGQYFGAAQGSSTISFNGTQATPTSWSDTQIVAPVPTGATTGQVSATVNGVVSNGGYGPTFTVVPQPTITGVNPASGTAGTAVSISGSGFGISQGSSSVSLNGAAATANSWSDSSITAIVPNGASSGNWIVTVAAQQSNAVAFAVVIPVLSGQFSQTLTAVTLTSNAALDWEHWGISDDQPLVRMASAAPILSDFTVIGPNAPTLLNDGEVEYLWTDGAPLASAERTTSGVSVSGAGNGFHLSVPADTTPKTLVLYVGANNAQGQLTASLSDNSAASFVDSSLNSGQGNDLSGTYRIDFRAGQPGQALNIDYVLLTDEGNGAGLVGEVILESAELFPRLPVISLTSPSDGQVFGYPSDVNAAASASQIDVPVSKVDLFSDSQDVLELTTSPYSFDLSGLTPGDHVLTVAATDVNGLASMSDPVLVAEIQGGGSLSASINTPSNIDLSAGTTDWVHWGNLDSTNNVDRKAGVTPQISDFNTLANGDVLVADDASQGGVSYSWSGGTPTDTQAGTTTQVFMQGYKNGFTLTIPADTTVRIAMLYLGYGFGTSQLRASLSDGSATPWVNMFSTTDFYDEKVVTFQFQAASAGQKLTISDQVIADAGFAYVDLEAATVTDQNSPVINSVTPPSAGPGTTLTISGSNFGNSPVGTVTLSGSALTVNSWSNSTITATLAGGYASGPIVVSQGLANSNGFAFTYLGPVITSLIPSAGPPGTLVTINGQNLGGSQSPVTVTFGGLQANVISQGPGAIQVTVPSGISFGPAQVVAQTSGGITNALQFDVVHAPVITSLTPNFGITGQMVKIYGTNFGLLQADSSVSFGEVSATPVSWSESLIQAPVPAGFYGGVVTVTVAGQRSNGMPFEVPLRCLVDCNAQRTGISLSPQNLSLVVGDQVDLGVVDNLGESVPYATFTVSDPTLGTVTTNNGIGSFSALAPGTVTVTATDASLNSSATITIYAGPTLPDGTIQWQLPASVVGSSAANFIQAQPAPNSATATFVEDLSDLDHVIIRALDAYGRQLWAWPTGTDYSTLFATTPVAPTPSGGFVYPTRASINSIDANGHPLWSYPHPQFTFEPLTVGYDGTVYALVAFENFSTNRSEPTHLVALDAQQGTEKFRVPLPQGHFLISGTDHDAAGPTGPGIVSRPIVLADGSINLAVWNSNVTEIFSTNSHQANPSNNSHDPNRTGNTIWCPADVLECWAPVDSFGNVMKNQSDITEGQEISLVNVQPDGTYKQYQLSNTQVECVEFGEHFQYVQDDARALLGNHVGGIITLPDGTAKSDGHLYQENIGLWFTGTCGVLPPGPNGADLMVVPNGSGGVLVASETNDAGNPVWIKNIPQPAASGDGAEISLASLNTLNRIVIGENGTAFAAGTWNFFETPRMVSFNLGGGTNWNYDSPFGTPDSPGYVDIIAAGPNGSLYAVEGDLFNQEPKSAFTLDGSGNRTDNPTSNQQLTFLASAGIGGGTWLGANLPPTVASLGGSGMPFGSLPFMQSGIPVNPPGITAYGANTIDGIHSTYAAPSPSGAERSMIPVSVYKVEGIVTSDDTAVQKTKNALKYWEAKAGILFKYDGTALGVPGCAPDPIKFPNGCDGNHSLDITQINDPTAANEFVRRFCDPSLRPKCQPKGVQLVFISQVAINLVGTTAQGYTPATGPTSSPVYMNISAIAANAIEDDNTGFLSGHGVSHEIGHEFQLLHLPSSFLQELVLALPFPLPAEAAFNRNLMCHALVSCPDTPAPGLFTFQIRKAQKAAAELAVPLRQ